MARSSVFQELFYYQSFCRCRHIFSQGDKSGPSLLNLSFSAWVGNLLAVMWYFKGKGASNERSG